MSIIGDPQCPNCGSLTHWSCNKQAFSLVSAPDPRDAELSSLRARVREMEEGLRPFARIAVEVISPDESDDAMFCLVGEECEYDSFAARDFRRAAALLAPPEPLRKVPHSLLASPADTARAASMLTDETDEFGELPVDRTIPAGTIFPCVTCGRTGVHSCRVAKCAHCGCISRCCVCGSVTK